MQVFHKFWTCPVIAESCRLPQSLVNCKRKATGKRSFHVNVPCSELDASVDVADVFLAAAMYENKHNIA